MEIATVVAFLAFFIALVALWLTSDVLKKVESQNEKFLRAHLKGLQKNIKEISIKLHALQSDADRLGASAATADQRINDHTKAIDHARACLAKLNTDVEFLDRSIPQRYRTIAPKPHDNAKKSMFQ